MNETPCQLAVMIAVVLAVTMRCLSLICAATTSHFDQTRRGSLPWHCANDQLDDTF